MTADRRRGGISSLPVITGLGAVSCLGDGVPALWAGLLRAEPAPGTAPDDCGLDGRPLVHRIAPEVRARLAGSPAGAASALALRAAREALAQAGLTDPAAAGLALGTSLGDVDVLEAGEAVGQFGVTAAVAGALGLTGPTAALSTACSSGAYAVGWGVEAIATGAAEVVLVGGTDVYSRVAVAGMDRIGVLDPVRCRPFDADRAGMVMGEGAAVLVLESAAHAAARGAVPLAVIEGVGWSSDGYHPTTPEPAARRLTAAIADAVAAAGIEPSEVGAVLPHRSGIRINDGAENAALAAVLGTGTPGYAMKAVLGHTSGAAAAFSCLVAALCLREGTVPPNAPVAVPDPDCALSAATAARPLPSAHVLISATGFGGANGALVLGAAA
jgi:3-oxoacyl-[acyl-carrier-protein] synthase II